MKNVDSARPIVILLADDDEEDRMLAADALEASRVVNDLRFVEDGEELLDYLYHRGRYAEEFAVIAVLRNEHQPYWKTAFPR